MPDSLKRIVCADDEEDILAIVEMCLAMLPNVEIATCVDGAQALSRTREFKPDLVLLDVMMPAMDGPTTLRAMAEDAELKDIPVILMTARVQPSEVAEYVSMGAIGVIPKPFDPMTLADDLMAIWKRHRAG